ncbi:MAG: rod shape-determining protein MreC [Gammaproteobacteria bacterium]|nr:rod shape-determining protein MreC [Gammaproteobacteria bacterium]
MRYWVQTVLSPLQYSVGMPARVFYKTMQTFSSHQTLLRENKSLEMQLILFKLQQQHFQDLERENKQLRDLLRIAQGLSMRVMVAEVLYIAADAQGTEWILDQGETRGVHIGQPVLNVNGVLGQIVEVGPITSRLMLITDTMSGIPVESATTGMRAILQGQGAGHALSLMFIPKTEHVDIGDIFVSSGIDGHFPRGYPVGQVVSVESAPTEQFLSIRVAPAANINRQSYVLLVEHAND